MKRRGFTLIELLVVISIISLLSSVVLANVTVARNKARNASHLENIVQIRNALALYAEENNGRFPDTFINDPTDAADVGDVDNPFYTPDPRYGTGDGAIRIHSSNSWIPGLVPTYIASLPSYRSDGKLPFTSNQRDVTGVDTCATRSTTYFYVSDSYSYKLIVACPEGGVPPTSTFKDPDDASGHHSGYMICYNDPEWNQLTGRGLPCVQNW